MIDKIKAIIAQGEGLCTEFKTATTDIPHNVYETVCAFLNTSGGDILLGVNDNGEVIGVDPDCIFSMQQVFSSSVNNNQIINPPFYLQLKPYDIDGKTVLHVFIPESSQVHRHRNHIFIRSHDGDMNITDNQTLVFRLYNQKASSYSENKIFAAVTMDDLRPDLFDRVRKIVRIRDGNHPWLTMDNIQLLQTMGLYQKDLNTGETGFTLACILLFGKDEVIHSAVPAYKVDLVKRVINKDRYDDREVLSTNLIETYDKAMAFIEKHLPSPFYLEKDERIDLRSIIFREIIANAIVHKEYSGAEPTRIVIEEEKVYTENSNKPYINGFITTENMSSHPKNPTIAKFFRELGLVEELGSGFKKLFDYARVYAGSDPIIQDLATFRVTLPIQFFKNNQKDSASSNEANTQAAGQGILQAVQQVSDQPSDQVSDQARVILQFCETPKALVEIMRLVRFKNRVYFMTHVIKPLIEKELIERIYPDKPNHPNQKYVTSKGRK